MKARVKEIGKEFNVRGILTPTADAYAIEEVDLFFDESDNMELLFSEDYWEKLKHQYAGMAMQGILSNPELFKAITKNAEEFGLIVPQAVAIDANCFATALVEKLKESKV